MASRPVQPHGSDDGMGHVSQRAKRAAVRGEQMAIGAGAT
jgi:hypothetical protein